MTFQGVQSVGPARAIVTPRGSPARGGEVLPLEKYVRDLYKSHPLIAIVGPSGSGKTTAIRHLAHELRDLPITFLDGEPDVDPLVSGALVFTCTSYTGNGWPTLVLQLAPWGESEWVDYLLARYPKQIRSIMTHLEACDCIDELEGSPRLWTAVMDWMAKSDSQTDVRELLRAIYSHALLMLESHAAYTERLLALSYHTDVKEPKLAPSLLWHRVMRRFALTAAMLREIESEPAQVHLLRFLPDAPSQDDLVRVLRGKPVAAARLLERIAAGEQPLTPTGVSVAVALDPSYRAPPTALNLRRAHLARVRWSDVRLAGVNLEGADLRLADLREADLANASATDANCSRADFSAAKMACARLKGGMLREATFADADLESANLSHVSAHAANFNYAHLDRAVLNHADLYGASFVGASLINATLIDARLDACDFTHANLEEALLLGADLRNVILHHAKLESASLSRAILEGLAVEQLNASYAIFASADLTGASFKNAILRVASFRNAGLADIDLEGADLREAFFDNAAFHMGSSRSGLVDSPIACEGSRTGFYTDDSHETYKHPEEIRKANLCGADLTGARVEKTDWYLVDLRGAKYSTQQAMWFRHCGAILFDRT